MKLRIATSRTSSILLLTATTFFGGFTTTFAAGPTPAKRVALLFGNGDYGSDPVSGDRDAAALEKHLDKLGFAKITKVPDGTIGQWTQALSDFSSEVKDADLVLFFYSGHGFASNGENYLIPKDGDSRPEASLPVSSVLTALGWAPNTSPKLLFINACWTAKRANGASSLAQPPAPPIGVMQSFAASPGQIALSGTSDPPTLSPYTNAVLRYLGQPGLPLVDALSGIRDDVFNRGEGQEPRAWGFESMNKLSVRPPVVLQAVLDDFDDGVSVIVNGEVVLDSSMPLGARKPVTLRPGNNDLSIVVANFRSFHNNQSWERTEGWKYKVRLFTESGLEVTWPGCPEQGCFADHEDAPFKDGPHHGQIFQVARAQIYVDPASAVVSIQNPETDIARRSLPFYAQDSTLLFCSSLAALGLDQDPKLGRYLKVLDLVQKLVRAVKLQSSIKFPDLNNLYAQVWGNAALGDAVKTCMSDPGHLQDRFTEAALAVENALAGNSKPFQVFDRGLSQCVIQASEEIPRANLEGRQEIIWTNFGEDRPNDPIEAVCTGRL